MESALLAVLPVAMELWVQVPVWPVLLYEYSGRPHPLLSQHYFVRVAAIAGRRGLAIHCGGSRSEQRGDSSGNQCRERQCQSFD